ncbi:MAG: hypothetical protein AB7O97_01400 [Planctomycetota bacterium]
MLVLAGGRLAAQAPAAPRPQEPAPAEPARLGTTFDSRGWPVVEPVPARPDFEVGAPAAGEMGAAAAAPGAGGAPPAAIESTPAVTVQPGAVGAMLPEVFRAVRSPGAFRALAGVSIWWRLTVHGPQGESIGLREMTHLLDASGRERDRIELAEGLVYGRLGAAVFAERHGMPWPTATDRATAELELFGLHARLPWAFADQREFAEVAAENVDRNGEPFVRVRLMRRTPGGELGPDPTARPADAFELWCPPGGGPPREFAYTLAAAGKYRRVLLEDWREVEGVAVPFRRVYVDAAGRPTTTLEILRWQAGVPVSDRDFRLH